MNFKKSILLTLGVCSVLASSVASVPVHDVTTSSWDPYMNLASNYLRPLYKNLDYLGTGLSIGFLNVNPKTPLYCFTDAIT